MEAAPSRADHHPHARLLDGCAVRPRPPEVLQSQGPAGESDLHGGPRRTRRRARLHDQGARNSSVRSGDQDERQARPTGRRWHRNAECLRLLQDQVSEGDAACHPAERPIWDPVVTPSTARMLCAPAVPATTTTTIPCSVPTGLGRPCQQSSECCPVPHGSVFCGGSPMVCRLGVCDPGYQNCNLTAADGCEVNLNTDPSNCRSCGRVCPTGLSCVMGSCR